MVRRIAAIVFIYICTAAAWMILAATVLVRTESQNDRLREAVGQLWGTAHTQMQPQVYYKIPSSSPSSDADKQSEAVEYLALDSSEIEVDLRLEHRRKGLLWYSIYQVQFSGKYGIANPFAQPCVIYVDFAFPSEQAIYDNFRFSADGQDITDAAVKSGRFVRAFEMEPGQTKQIEIAYASQGMDEWIYNFGGSVKQVKNFSLVMTTDFDRIDFPQHSVSPTAKEQTAKGWKLTWTYNNLLTGACIGMTMPKKLNPGPWVSRVTAAAPVSLFLFFFLLFICATMREIKIHPMNYFFIGAAFFSFHLLLAYLVDYISIHTAFWICSAVSIVLVVSYMRLVVGLRFAFLEAALFQLVYLVLFSYTFFFEGYTGLAITVLCICTLFVVMQMTGRLDWEKVFANGPQKAAKPLNRPDSSEGRIHEP